MFERIIRSKRRFFDELSWEEVARMIEADSALSEGGNNDFSGCALDEFIYSEDVLRPDLRELQRYLRRRIYLRCPDSSERRIDTDLLRNVILRIRAGDIAPDEWD